MFVSGAKAGIMITVRRTNAFMAVGCRVCWVLMNQGIMQSAELTGR